MSEIKFTTVCVDARPVFDFSNILNGSLYGYPVKSCFARASGGGKIRGYPFKLMAFKALM